MNLHPRAGVLASVITLSVLVAIVPASQFASAASPHEMASSMLAVTGTLPPDPAACATMPGGGTIPVGQANPPGSESEPMAPIWCFPLAAPGAPTRVSGPNSWVDTFTGVTQMGRFQDGDYDYRLFNNVGSPGVRTQHFTNNNHWMIDRSGDGEAGALLRPNRSFTFQDGKLVVETDVASGITAYDPETWVEIDVSTGDQPTIGQSNDNLYAYGQFVGQTTFGCRLQSVGLAVCSHIANTQRAAVSGPQVDSNPCFEGDNGWRLIEISGGEPCGSVHTGDFHGGNAANFWRQCNSVSQIPDMQCRDRFRMELSQAGMVLYVNGFKYFEDSSWPARNQLPANVTNGSVPVYVYFSDYGSVHGQEQALRYHWQRLAVNPTNGPNTAPSFCLGQPNNTCAMAATPAPTVVPNTPVPPTSTSVPNTPVPPTSTAVPSATNTPVPTIAACRVWVSKNGGDGEWQSVDKSLCGLP